MRAKKTLVSMFAVVLAVYLAIACVANAALAHEQTVFILIGGDGDNVRASNNLFQQSEKGVKIGDIAKTVFIESPDYEKRSASGVARFAEKKILENSGYICLGGFSHGGQAVYYTDLTNVNEVYLFDGFCSISGQGDSVNCWVDWAKNASRAGIKLYLFATNDDRPISERSRIILDAIKKAKLNNVYTEVLSCSHGQACVRASSGVINHLKSL